jgi:outer membrane biosynthesis protein TonB
MRLLIYIMVGVVILLPACGVTTEQPATPTSVAVIAEVVEATETPVSPEPAPTEADTPEPIPPTVQPTEPSAVESPPVEPSETPTTVPPTFTPVPPTSTPTPEIGLALGNRTHGRRVDVHRQSGCPGDDD